MKRRRRNEKQRKGEADVGATKNKFEGGRGI